MKLPLKQNAENASVLSDGQISEAGDLWSDDSTDVDSNSGIRDYKNYDDLQDIEFIAEDEYLDWLEDVQIAKELLSNLKSKINSNVPLSYQEALQYFSLCQKLEMNTEFKDMVLQWLHTHQQDDFFQQHQDEQGVQSDQQAEQADDNQRVHFLGKDITDEGCMLCAKDVQSDDEESKVNPSKYGLAACCNTFLCKDCYEKDVDMIKTNKAIFELLRGQPAPWDPNDQGDGEVMERLRGLWQNGQYSDLPKCPFCNIEDLQLKS